jgi:hypothetical protein
MSDHSTAGGHRRAPTLGDWQARPRTGQGEACKDVPSLPTRQQRRAEVRTVLMRINEWPKNLSPRGERRKSIVGSVNSFMKANPNPAQGGLNGEVVSEG